MSNKAVSIFARLVKIDEAKRTITGVIADETPDVDNEVMDYDSSKPHFKAWSANVAKASGGKSVGNVRAMHSKVAAGRLTDIVMDDLNKSIMVTAEIVDDGEWNKCLKAVYTGFSIGGKYGKKWDDGGFKRYTAVPSEVSLADVPCNPSATFEVVKTDGAIEMRKVAGGELVGEVDADPLQAIEAVPAVVAREDYENVMKAVDSIVDEAERVRVKAELAKVIACEPDEEQPDLFEQIVEKCKTDEKLQGLVDDMLRHAGRPELAKGMCDAAGLCSLFESLGWRRDSAKFEAQLEGDNSKVPGMLDNVLRALGDAVIAMVKEEVAETIAKTDAGGDMQKGIGGGGGEEEAAQDFAPMCKALGIAEDSDSDAVVAGLAKVVRERDEAQTALRKAHSQIGELNGAATELNKKLKAANEEIDTLRKVAKTPDPAAPAPRLRVVDKGADVEASTPDDSLSKVVGPDGQVDEVATMIKQAHRQGSRPLQRTAADAR